MALNFVSLQVTRMDVKADCEPHPGFLTQEAGWGGEFACLTNVQMLLMQLVQGPLREPLLRG